MASSPWMPEDVGLRRILGAISRRFTVEELQSARRFVAVATDLWGRNYEVRRFTTARVQGCVVIDYNVEGINNSPLADYNGEYSTTMHSMRQIYAIDEWLRMVSML